MDKHHEPDNSKRSCVQRLPGYGLTGEEAQDLNIKTPGSKNGHERQAQSRMWFNGCGFKVAQTNRGLPYQSRTNRYGTIVPN